jgi:hypothetical protein
MVTLVSIFKSGMYTPLREEPRSQGSAQETQMKRAVRMLILVVGLAAMVTPMFAEDGAPIPFKNPNNGGKVVINRR